MATGYTYGVVEGEITEFKDFLLQCARAFGYCINQRDDDLRDPPKLITVNDYCREDVIEAEEKLKEALKESLDDFIIREKIQLKKQYDYCVEYEKEKQRKKDRLEKMLQSSKDWNPPSAEHDGLKKFMIEQLEETIEYDYKMPPIPEIDYDLDWAKLKEEEIDGLKRDVEYYKNKYREHVAFVNKTNKWITDLYASLK
jgi:hypothetical protein